MRPNKQFIQEVANGKYNDQDIHGELQRAAQRILDEKVCSKFSSYCFLYHREWIRDESFADIYDAFTDFLGFGAEIRVPVPTSVHPTGVWQVFGMTAAESLEELYIDACCNMDLWNTLEGTNFKIRGEKGLFRMDTEVWYQCFDKGRVTHREAVNYCRVPA